MSCASLLVYQCPLSPLLEIVQAEQISSLNKTDRFVSILADLFSFKPGFLYFSFKKEREVCSLNVELVIHVYCLAVIIYFLVVLFLIH